MSSSPLAVDCTTEDGRVVAATGPARCVQVEFFETEAGLHALQITAAVPVSLALLEVLHRLGVVLVAFDVRHGDTHSRQRYALTEPDGTAVRQARLVRLQSEILALVEHAVGGEEPSPP